MPLQGIILRWFFFFYAPPIRCWIERKMLAVFRRFSYHFPSAVARIWHSGILSDGKHTLKTKAFVLLIPELHFGNKDAGK